MNNKTKYNINFICQSQAFIMNKQKILQKLNLKNNIFINIE